MNTSERVGSSQGFVSLSKYVLSRILYFIFCIFLHSTYNLIITENLDSSLFHFKIVKKGSGEKLVNRIGQSLVERIPNNK